MNQPAIEVQGYEAHREDIIVFATSPADAVAVETLVAMGFWCATTGNGKNETVVTVHNDIISFQLGGVEYFTNLARAISVAIQRPVYLRIEDEDYEATASTLTAIDEIPEPVVGVLPNMKGPKKGWMGATRDSLWRAIRKFGENGLIEEMKDYVRAASPSHTKKIIKNLLTKHGI